MSQYDEDVYENPFLITLERDYKALYERATANRWVVCIPKFSAVKKNVLVREDFEDHILIPSSDTESAFTTVSNHKVEIQQGQINLGSGLKANTVHVLFEETFYNAKDESYRVVCVSGFFNRENNQEENSGESDYSKAPASYDECIKILWGQQGNSKTRDSLDKLLKVFCGEYQRFEGNAESIPNLADLVSSHMTKSMQIILKDQNIKKLVKQHDLYMASLTIAAETYVMNAVHKHLFSTITACVKSKDALVNKMNRNLIEIRLQHLDVRSEFEENLPYAKKELSRLNQFSTPLGRLFCLKRVVTALTKPLFKSQENEGLVMTSDDLLPLLIYLIIKSQIPNWTANLMYMKFFQMAKMSESDEFSFYLATTEAALDFICSGNVKQTKTSGYSKEAGISRQPSSGTSSSKEKFFQYVQYGDEAAVSLMLKKQKPSTDDIAWKLCHPLCTCDKCQDITATTTQNSGAVSCLARDDMGRTALHIAAFYGQGTLIDVLSKHGCLADATDYLGCTPLHLASQKGYQNIILLLVHFGADIGAIDNEGNTPLHLCAKNGHEDCVKAILFLDILKNKLNVNAQNDMGDTPLHMAARWGYDGIVNFLLESEADPRIRNRKRQTPYNMAQNADIRKELKNVMNDPPPMIIRHPVMKPSTLPVSNHKPTAPNSTPTSPKMTSPDNTSTSQSQTPLGFEVVDVKPRKPEIQLIDNSSSEMMSPTTPAVASLDQTDLRQIDKLFKAIANKDIPLVEYYFGWEETSTSSDESPLTPPTTPIITDKLATRLCHPLCQCEKCQHLQKLAHYQMARCQQATVTCTDPDQPAHLCHLHSSRNTLHVNCQNKKGFAPLHIAVIEDNMDLLKLLLVKGAFVNIQTHKHITPLHLACFHEKCEMLEKLVTCGANVNLADKHGEIPLHLAAAKSSVPMVTCLLQHSSSVNLGNINGNTSLHHAVCTECESVVSVLLEYGANPDIRNKHNKLPRDLTKNEAILEMLNKKSRELREQAPSVPKSGSTPNSPMVKHQGNDKLKELVSGIDDLRLDALHQLSESVKTFDRQRQLKRSMTFDHSTPAVHDPSLKLTQSIQHFDKEKSLKKAHTLDRSAALLEPLRHSLSIQHFDFSTLKHVEPVDKSSPIHLLSLTRSYSCYNDYTDSFSEEHDNALSNKKTSEGNSEIDNVKSKSENETVDNSVESKEPKGSENIQDLPKANTENSNIENVETDNTLQATETVMDNTETLANRAEIVATKTDKENVAEESVQSNSEESSAVAKDKSEESITSESLESDDNASSRDIEEMSKVDNDASASETDAVKGDTTNSGNVHNEVEQTHKVEEVIDEATDFTAQ